MEETQTQENNTTASAGITRRRFIRRTTGTAVGIALALHCFREEVLATEAAGSSDFELEYEGGHITVANEVIGVVTGDDGADYQVTYSVTCSHPDVGARSSTFTASATISVTFTKLVGTPKTPSVVPADIFSGPTKTGKVVKTLLNPKRPESISYSGSDSKNGTETVKGNEVTVVATASGDSVILQVQMNGGGTGKTVNFSMPVVTKEPKK